MMWVISTGLFGTVIILEGIAVFDGTIDVRSEWIKNLIMFLAINPAFIYIFLLWGRRDRERSLDKMNQN